MELDDLKDLWKKGGPDFKPKDAEEIALMLKGRSKSIVDKLKRSVWFELTFTLLAGVALLIYALTLESGALKWTSISILVLFVVYIFYYIKKLSLLNRFDPGNDNLRATVETLTTNLTSYLRFYKRSYTMLYPVYFILGILFGGLERGTEHFIRAFSKASSIGYVVALALFFFFCSTWLTNWYLKKLYGNHLEKLKTLTRELQG